VASAAHNCRSGRRSADRQSSPACRSNRGAQKGKAAAQRQAAQQQAAQAQAAAAAQPDSPSVESKTADLKQLKELLDSGILTQEEVDEQKAQILSN
jgi:hypothetical protein